MRCESKTEYAVYSSLEALPADALGLFGTMLGDSLAWYRAVVTDARPMGGTPAFLVVGQPAHAVFPMWSLARGAGSLTTPYTCLWRPLTAPGSTMLEAAGLAVGAWCRRFASVRLDAMDLCDARWTAILRGAGRAGMVALPFDHFGNWHADLARLDWAAYLAARPGALREILRRRGARLAASTLRVVHGGAELEAAITAYEAVYAKSWKGAEPYPTFHAALMREMAAEGSLRLGFLEQGESVLAAQIWVVRGGTATVLKLAHNEAYKADSPGTVLTGRMIRAVMEQDGVSVLDFGRGDDGYKRDWTDARAQRAGIVLANPRTLGGGWRIVGNRVKESSSFLKKRTKKLLSV